MKKLILIVSLFAWALAACGPSNAQESIPTVMLEGGNPPSSTQPAGSGATVSASATVVPIAKARLSFTSVGRVTSVNVQAGDEVEAGDVLAALDTSILEAKVREAEANLAFAETELKYLIRVIGCRGEGCAPSYKHIEVAENEVARAQALLDSARAVLESQSNLTAPFSGTVVSVDISPGETVVPGEVVIVLGDLSRFRIETTDLSERNIGRIKMGQTADVYIEALDAYHTGKVVEMDRIASALGGDVVYTVTIDLNTQPQGLLWGMSADVEFRVEE
jgi:HlyD family secretion protein